MDQNALILDQASLPCLVDRCSSLGSILRRTLRFKHVEERHNELLPATISFIPHVILLRVSDKPPSERLVSACKLRWNFAPVLAILCPGQNQPIVGFSSFLCSVDDFLSCPYQETELFFRIKRLLQSKPGVVASSLTEDLRDRLNHPSLVGNSEPFLRVVEKIPLLARCSTTILITGETGSGKEVVARAIHYQSARSGKPFVPVNCGALPEHLFENELFGHARGAFTDAFSAQKGLIAEAE
jgi:DNA-binding NtrC family response regulator